MKDTTIIATGVIGAVAAALCCFTPVLVVLLGAVGLSAWRGGLDSVLLPTLAIFLGIAGYGVWRRRLTCGTADRRPENGGL